MLNYLSVHMHCVSFLFTKKLSYRKHLCTTNILTCLTIGQGLGVKAVLFSLRLEVTVCMLTILLVQKLLFSI